MWVNILWVKCNTILQTVMNTPKYGFSLRRGFRTPTILMVNLQRRAEFSTKFPFIVSERIGTKH